MGPAACPPLLSQLQPGRDRQMDRGHRRPHPPSLQNHLPDRHQQHARYRDQQEGKTQEKDALPSTTPTANI